MLVISLMNILWTWTAGSVLVFFWLLYLHIKQYNKIGGVEIYIGDLLFGIVLIVLGPLTLIIVLGVVFVNWLVGIEDDKKLFSFER